MILFHKASTKALPIIFGSSWSFGYLEEEELRPQGKTKAAVNGVFVRKTFVFMTKGKLSNPLIFQKN